MSSPALPRCQPTAANPGPSAFSLIEVLVVVATLSLLMAILLPSLSRARTNSRHVVCQSNLHQISLAWDLYLHDNRDHYLQVTTVSGPELNYGGRQGSSKEFRKKKRLNPYTGLRPIATTGAEQFRCPLDVGSAFAQPTCFAAYGTSYSLNVALTGNLVASPKDPYRDLIVAAGKQCVGLRRGSVDSPAKVILNGDYGWKNAWDDGVSDVVDWHPRAGWHNIAFVDGHVAYAWIRKGVHTTGDYTVIPFGPIQRATASSAAAVRP